MIFKYLKGWYQQFFKQPELKPVDSPEPDETFANPYLRNWNYRSITMIPETGADGNYLAVGSNHDYIYKLFQTMFKESTNQDVLVLNNPPAFEISGDGSTSKFYVNFTNNTDIRFLLNHIRKDWFKQPPLLIILNPQQLDQTNRSILAKLFYQKKIQIWIHSPSLNLIEEIFGPHFFAACRQLLFFNLPGCDFTNDQLIQKKLSQIPVKQYIGLAPEVVYQLFPHFIPLEKTQNNKLKKVELGENALWKTV